MQAKVTKSPKSKLNQSENKTLPQLKIKTNIKAGACCNSGWSDRNVKENFAVVDGLEVLTALLEEE